MILIPQLSARSLHSISIVVTILVVTVGCGGERAIVTGNVTTTDGTPLQKARITVRKNDAVDWATAVTDSAGNFSLGTDKEGNGVPPGDYLVSVVEDTGNWDDPQPPKIHNKYRQQATSGLTLTVTPGERKQWDLVLDPP